MFAVHSGTVYLVGAGPGDPGLITLRGLACLSQAQVVVHDRLIDRWLLGLADGAEFVNVGKQPDHHPVPQEQINAILVDRARKGQVVVRLKGGDPFVFGRGGEEAQALVEAGIRFEVVPGVSSAVAVPAYAGIPVTHRGVAASVAFVTGHRAAGLGPDNGPALDWAHLAHGVDTLVMLMGVHNLPDVVENLLAHGRSLNTPVALIQQGTYATQKTVQGTLENIVERSAQIHPPAITVVGEVVRLQESLGWFENQFKRSRPLLGLRVLTTRSTFNAQGMAQERPVQRFLSTVLPGSFLPHPLDAFFPLHARLAELGAEPVQLPITQVAASTDQSQFSGVVERLLDSGQRPAFDWICFTSPNTALFFCERLFEYGLDTRCLHGIKLAVLGLSAAQVLRSFGLAADVVAAGRWPESQATSSAANSSQVLAQMMLAYDRERQSDSKRCLVPCSNQAAPRVVEVLQRHHLKVETVEVYMLRPAPQELVRQSPAFHMLLDGEVDVVTLFNPSAVKALEDVFSSRQHMLEVLAKTKLACIGPSTAAQARRQGLQVDLVPQSRQTQAQTAAMQPPVSATEVFIEALIAWCNEH